MKQLVILTLVVSFLGALALPVSSQNSDTLEVLVSPAVVLSVNITQTEVDYGALALSPSNASRTTLASNTLTVTNSGNAPADLMIGGSNVVPVTTGSDWLINCDPADVGTVNGNQYVHQYFTVAAGAGSAQALCAGNDKLLEAGVASNGTVDFRLRMNMPTATTGFGQRTSTVTITAVQP